MSGRVWLSNHSSESTTSRNGFPTTASSASSSPIILNMRAGSELVPCFMRMINEQICFRNLKIIFQLGKQCPIHLLVPPQPIINRLLFPTNKSPSTFYTYLTTSIPAHKLITNYQAQKTNSQNQRLLKAKHHYTVIVSMRRAYFGLVSDFSIPPKPGVSEKSPEFGLSLS